MSDTRNVPLHALWSSLCCVGLRLLGVDASWFVSGALISAWTVTLMKSQITHGVVFQYELKAL